MKVREIIRLIEADGWIQIQAKGGHRQYKHPIKTGRVTVSGKLSNDVHPKTLRSMLRQAQLRRQ